MMTRRAAAPAARRLASLMLSWFNVRSRRPINRPIHVTGCPNSCGQHWIADIGLEGKKTKVDGQIADAYYFCVGGAVGRNQSKARPVGYRVAATEVPDAIARLLRSYLAERRDNAESFRAFCARHTDAELRERLAGAALAAVERDSASGHLPSGVDG